MYRLSAIGYYGVKDAMEKKNEGLFQPHYVLQEQCREVRSNGYDP